MTSSNEDLIYEAINGNIDSRNKFIESNMTTIRKIAMKYGVKFGVDFDDALNEAIIAVCKSFNNYDPKLGIEFFTYSTYNIHRRIIEYSRFNKQLSVGVKYIQYHKSIMLVIKGFREKHDRMPGLLEIKEFTGMSKGRILDILNANMPCIDPVYVDHNFSVDDALIKEEFNNKLKEVINELKPMYGMIIQKYYFNENGKITDYELSRLEGLTESAINLRRSKVLKNIRKKMKSEGLL